MFVRLVFASSVFVAEMLLSKIESFSTSLLECSKHRVQIALGHFKFQNTYKNNL